MRYSSVGRLEVGSPRIGSERLAVARHGDDPMTNAEFVDGRRDSASTRSMRPAATIMAACPRSGFRGRTEPDADSRERGGSCRGAPRRCLQRQVLLAVRSDRFGSEARDPVPYQLPRFADGTDLDTFRRCFPDRQSFAIFPAEHFVVPKCPPKKFAPRSIPAKHSTETQPSRGRKPNDYVRPTCSIGIGSTVAALDDPAFPHCQRARKTVDFIGQTHVPAWVPHCIIYGIHRKVQIFPETPRQPRLTRTRPTDDHDTRNRHNER